MSRIQISSVDAPFDRPEIGRAATELLGLSDAMGLLPKTAHYSALNWTTLRGVVKCIAKAGIARSLAAELQNDLEPTALRQHIERLARALEDNPLPEFEWGRLHEVFPAEELANLLGISPSSVGRYRSSERTTPDDVAARLHFLARVLHSLEGAYNELGVRQWFRRPRVALDQRSPGDILRDTWDPEGKDALRVLKLAGSLSGSSAT